MACCTAYRCMVILPAGCMASAGVSMEFTAEVFPPIWRLGGRGGGVAMTQRSVAATTVMNNEGQTQSDNKTAYF